jgi:hypothetical protein
MTTVYNTDPTSYPSPLAPASPSGDPAPEAGSLNGPVIPAAKLKSFGKGAALAAALVGTIAVGAALVAYTDAAPSRPAVVVPDFPHNPGSPAGGGSNGSPALPLCSSAGHCSIRPPNQPTMPRGDLPLGQHPLRIQSVPQRQWPLGYEKLHIPAALA